MMWHGSLIVASMAVLTACNPGGQAQDGGSILQEHADQQATELAVATAINTPGGGDYARAVVIVRASDLPQDQKDFEIGQLVVAAHTRPAARRPTETLGQGLTLLEQSAVRPGNARDAAQQQLRMLFERGEGTPPAAIPIDAAVAQCWRGTENGGTDDPARCVALRKERLPQLSK